MVYRDAHVDGPLISFLGRSLFALHPVQGTMLWEQTLAAVPRRVVVVGQSLFVATHAAGSESSKVLLFELLTGAPRGSFDARFDILTALVSSDRVYFGGRRGLLALRADGTVLFHAVPEEMAASTWSSRSAVDVVMKDASGREIWRLADATHSQADGLLVVDGDVAQPDYDT